MQPFFQSLDALRETGFGGFASISTLMRTECAEVQNVPGVYLVLRPSIAAPEFLEQSTGGHFKGKNPTVSISVLQQRWVEGAMVLYIGKAGPTEGRTLRVWEYMQFGKGIPIGHSGGKCVWQLRHSEDLLVCWKPTLDEAPREVEKRLIQEFEAIYGKIPFANGQR